MGREAVGRDPRLRAIDSLVDGTANGDRAWYRAIRELLESAYIAAADPFAQSGKGGGQESWERARRPVAEAIERDGTFLDVGCANGLLMDSVVNWAAEAGHRVEPFGLDLSAKLARLARRRYPRWAHRIAVGNVMSWRPRRRFDFVRTELVYVPPGRERALVERLVRRVVTPGGRLIICAYGRSDGQAPRACSPRDALTRWGYHVTGEAKARVADGTVVTAVAWIDS